MYVCMYVMCVHRVIYAEADLFVPFDTSRVKLFDISLQLSQRAAPSFHPVTVCYIPLTQTQSQTTLHA